MSTTNRFTKEEYLELRKRARAAGAKSDPKSIANNVADVLVSCTKVRESVKNHRADYIELLPHLQRFWDDRENNIREFNDIMVEAEALVKKTESDEFFEHTKKYKGLCRKFRDYLVRAMTPRTMKGLKPETGEILMKFRVHQLCSGAAESILQQIKKNAPQITTRVSSLNPEKVMEEITNSFIMNQAVPLEILRADNKRKVSLFDDIRAHFGRELVLTGDQTCEGMVLWNDEIDRMVREDKDGSCRADLEQLRVDPREAERCYAEANRRGASGADGGTFVASAQMQNIDRLYMLTGMAALSGILDEGLPKKIGTVMPKPVGRDKVLVRLAEIGFKVEKLYKQPLDINDSPALVSPGRLIDCFHIVSFLKSDTIPMAIQDRVMKVMCICLVYEAYSEMVKSKKLDEAQFSYHWMLHRTITGADDLFEYTGLKRGSVLGAQIETETGDEGATDSDESGDGGDGGGGGGGSGPPGGKPGGGTPRSDKAGGQVSPSTSAKGGQSTPKTTAGSPKKSSDSSGRSGGGVVIASTAISEKKDNRTEDEILGDLIANIQTLSGHSGLHVSGSQLSRSDIKDVRYFMIGSRNFEASDLMVDLEGRYAYSKSKVLGRFGLNEAAHTGEGFVGHSGEGGVRINALAFMALIKCATFLATRMARGARSNNKDLRTALAVVQAAGRKFEEAGLTYAAKQVSACLERNNPKGYEILKDCMYKQAINTGFFLNRLLLSPSGNRIGDLDDFLPVGCDDVIELMDSFGGESFDESEPSGASTPRSGKYGGSPGGDFVTGYMRSLENLGAGDA